MLNPTNELIGDNDDIISNDKLVSANNSDSSTDTKEVVLEYDNTTGASAADYSFNSTPLDNETHPITTPNLNTTTNNNTSTTTTTPPPTETQNNNINKPKTTTDSTIGNLASSNTSTGSTATTTNKIYRSPVSNLHTTNEIDDHFDGEPVLGSIATQTFTTTHQVQNIDDDDTYPLIPEDHSNTPISNSNIDAGDQSPQPIVLEGEDESYNPPPKIDRATWIRILVVFYAVLSDGLSLTLVQPFLPQILENKWGYTPEGVGTISGILVGCYSLARFFSGFYLGHFSDKYGRKPFLVLSLLMTGVGTLVFAFMPSVEYALAVRFIEGMMSNTTALCQATLSDIVDKRNRPAIFAYLGGTYALSRCLSSSMGGFLVYSFENKPNPYIYPCIIGGIIVLTSGFLILVLHPETHPAIVKRRALASGGAYHRTEDEESINNSITSEEESTSEKKESQISFKEGIKEILKNKTLVILLIVGSLNSFNNGGLLLGIVLFSSHPLVSRGLGFGPMKTGIVFTILGFAGFFFQIVFFKKMSASIGLKRQYILGMVLLCVGIALYPLTFQGFLLQGEALVWVFVAIIVPVISVGFMQGLPIVQGMVANASHPQLQGLTQGCSQSTSSVLRAFGPAISGAIFTFSAKHNITWLLFVVLSVIYSIIAVISLWIPESVDINRKKPQTNGIKLKELK